MCFVWANGRDLSLWCHKCPPQREKSKEKEKKEKEMNPLIVKSNSGQAPYCVGQSADLLLKVPAVRVGRVWRFDKETIDEWISEGQKRSRPKRRKRRKK